MGYTIASRVFGRFMSSRFHTVASGAVLAMATVCAGFLPGCSAAVGILAFPAAAEVSAAFEAGHSFVLLDVFGANRKQISRLRATGFNILARSGSRLRGTAGKEAWDEIARMGLLVKKLPAPDGTLPYDSRYTSYERMTQTLRQLERSHPELCRVEEIGRSHEGRAILALRVGRGAHDRKAAVAFTGGTHGREIVTPELVLGTARWLVEGYGSDPAATRAVDERDIWLTPIVNPDGHVRVEAGQDWRKNTNSRNGGQGLNPEGPGVDLNRNYGSPSWGTLGTSPDPGIATYCGPEPFSEPETRAMKRLYSSRKFAFLLTWHSMGNTVIWPFNDSEEPPPDDRLPELGRTLARAAGYDAMQGSKLYLDSGEEIDYAYREHGIPAILVEAGDFAQGFTPPYSEVAKVWGANRAIVEALVGLDPAAWGWTPQMGVVAPMLAAPDSQGPWNLVRTPRLP